MQLGVEVKRTKRQLLVLGLLIMGAVVSLSGLARTVIPRVERTVGVVTASVGVPWFIYRLRRRVV